tara:strand:+ start:6006 stop:6779 length:774 start_codon:yes stop_codon:yes gene_type:complete
MEETLNIALIQCALLWEDPEGNRTQFSKKIDAISGKVDLIVLPEMFHTGFTMFPKNIDKNEGQKTLVWMQQKAKSTNAALVGSLPFFHNDTYFNRLFFVLPDGSYHNYDKRHTFTLAGEDKVYRGGTKRLVVSYKGFRICPMICYDLRFPVWARNTEGYDILLYVANWPEPRINAWDALLKARAIENMAYCIGVNRTGTDATGYVYPGHSAVYDVLGELLAFSRKEEIIYVSLDKEHIVSTRNKLKFLDDRDQFTLL